MKRTCILTLFCVLCGFVAMAQKEYSRHEIYVAYGLSPKGKESKGILGTDDVAGVAFSNANEENNNTFSIGYAYCMSSRFSLGLSYTYSTYKSDVVLGSSIPLANTKTTNHMALINLKFQWLKYRNFSLYSRGGVGAKFCSKVKLSNVKEELYTPEEQKSKKILAWHVSIGGLEWRFIPNLAVFVEGGVGMQGSFLAGLRTHF
ncbi:MAG: outer membrane beta-barrel protein [Bacteroidales bacterium]|nr:outer membrane beta-barrel protein [Bacteroidales bacterium]MDD6132551.1 outer membrane beta-barrel protein [Bacteroidales bacterium]MDD6851174.1 outer membrane beta-barrel protein [Bacteroidales bacterium]